jgi:hypothetical protein
MSPFQILHGVTPVVPPAVRHKMQKPLDYVDVETCASYVLARAADMQRHCAYAFGNLQVAQQKDIVHYRMAHKGQVPKQVRAYQPGDFVFRRRHGLDNTLQVKYRPGIFMVAYVNPKDGGLTLMGKCGTMFHEHPDNTAPCLLSNIDPTVDPTMARRGQRTTHASNAT